MQNIKIMKNKFLIWFWILFPLLAFSQGENDNWYFGNKAAIRFAATSPLVLNNSAMNAPEACASVSNSGGELLFYTDGMTIWDRSHNIMPNSNGLSGTINSSQVLIIQDLVNKNRYYVFTTGDSYNNQSYTAYSVVDMTLPGSGIGGSILGDVVPSIKNIPVLDNNGSLITTGAVTAVPHANGTDFWILMPTHNDLLAYLYDSSGLNTTPVVSSLSPWNTFNYRTFYVKASPKLYYPIGFDYMVALGVGSSLEPNTYLSFSFDNNTGALLSWIRGATNANNGKLYMEFNEDGTKTYMSTFQNGNLEFYYHDYLNNIPSLPFIGAIPNVSAGQLQRNKKNEIYFTLDSTGYLGQILNPNSLNNPILDFTNIYLNGNDSSRGLPQLLPEHPGCFNDIVLISPENNNNHTYQANNSIITQTNYSITNKNIVMKAGNDIVMLPNTHISLGSEYVALIEDCPFSKPAKRYWTPPVNPKIDIIGSKNNETEQETISIFPNPTLSQFTINTENDKLDKWELFDLSGKLVLKGNNTVGSVENLASATYVLKVHSKDKTVNTIKLIKK